MFNNLRVICGDAFLKRCIYLSLAVLGLCCCRRAFPSSAGFSLWWPLLLPSEASGHPGFRCSSRAAADHWSVVGHTGLVALLHVGSSWTRNQTCVPWIVGAILNHWTTREALQRLFITQHFMEDTFTSDSVLTVSYTYLQEKSVLAHLLVFLVLFLPCSSFVSVWI